MTHIHTVNAQLTKRGNALHGSVAYDLHGRKPKDRTLGRSLMSPDLAAWFDAAQEGDRVEAEVSVDSGNAIKVFLGTEASAAAPASSSPDPDPRRAPVPTGTATGRWHPSARYLQALRDHEGAANPYTFVPTPPRGDLTAGPGPTGLGDASVSGLPSHAMIGPSRWTGTLRLRLTTVTPLLLLDEGSTVDTENRRSFGVRLDERGRPLLHGASLKGALRSAFETVTASRYGVFGPHDTPLAYRLSTDHGAAVRPAVVVRAGGSLVFRLCGTDDRWNKPPGVSDPIQPAALLTQYEGAKKQPRRGQPPVPMPRPDIKVSGGQTGDALHGRLLRARLHLYRMGSSSQNLFTTWVVTHLRDADDPKAMADLSATTEQDLPAWGPSLKAVRSRNGSPVPPVIALGVVCATGRSIDSKKHERFFPINPPFIDLPVKSEHHAMWNAVLDAYESAARYHRADTTSGSRRVGGGVERSWHVRHPDAARALDHLTPVWVELSSDEAEVVGVHPVMIGRKPFPFAPHDLLPQSLRPAGHEDGLAALSPADRLFGWAPAAARDGAEAPREPGTSVGFRGLLRVADVRCDASEVNAWTAEGAAFQRSHRERGIVLSPLSAPKPTQFRFYSAADDQGTPWADSTPKSSGYSENSGLRGRKMYRWRQESEDYWKPDVDRRSGSSPTSGPLRREYLALNEVEATQTIRVTDWVRPGVTFTADLRLDGVPPAELGALVWLLSQGDKAPLRLGHGKPLGFGVVQADIIWTDDGDGTRLWNGDAMIDRWRSLATPSPASRAEIDELAAQFASLSHPLLGQAREDYLTAARATDQPVRYPHSTSTPEATTFKWFLENERLSGSKIVYGWSLPHVTSSEQRLPHLPPRKRSKDRRP